MTVLNDEVNVNKTQATTSSLSASTRLPSLPDSPSWPQTEAEGGGWAAELKILGAPLPRSSSAGTFQIPEKLLATATPSEGDLVMKIEALRRTLWAVEAERDETKAEAEMIRREADVLEQRKGELTGRLALRGIPWDIEARLKHKELGNARLAVAYSVQVQRMQDELAHVTAERHMLDERLAALLRNALDAAAAAPREKILPDGIIRQEKECEHSAPQAPEVASDTAPAAFQDHSSTTTSKRRPAWASADRARHQEVGETQSMESVEAQTTDTTDESKLADVMQALDQSIVEAAGSKAQLDSLNAAAADLSVQVLSQPTHLAKPLDSTQDVQTCPPSQRTTPTPPMPREMRVIVASEPSHSNRENRDVKSGSEEPGSPTSPTSPPSPERTSTAPARSSSVSTLRPPLVPEAMNFAPPSRSSVRRMYSSNSPPPRTDSLAPPVVVRSSSVSRGECRGSFTVPAPWLNQAAMALRAGTTVNISRSPNRMSLSSVTATPGPARIKGPPSRSPTRTTWSGPPPGIGATSPMVQKRATSPMVQKREVQESPQEAQWNAPTTGADEHHVPKVAPAMKPADNRTSWPFRRMESVGNKVFPGQPPQDGLSTSAPTAPQVMTVATAMPPGPIIALPVSPMVAGQTRPLSPQRPIRVHVEVASQGGSAKTAAGASIAAPPGASMGAPPGVSMTAPPGVSMTAPPGRSPMQKSVGSPMVPTAITAPATMAAPTTVTVPSTIATSPTAPAPRAHIGLLSPATVQGPMSTPMKGSMRAPLSGPTMSPSPMRGSMRAPLKGSGRLSPSPMRSPMRGIMTLPQKVGHAPTSADRPTLADSRYPAGSYAATAHPFVTTSQQ